MADEGLKGGGCCGGKRRQATTITVYKATGVEKQDVVGGTVRYCSVVRGFDSSTALSCIFASTVSILLQEPILTSP